MAEPTPPAADSVADAKPQEPTPAVAAVSGAETSGALNAVLLKGKLSEAERLMSYAVETGVQVDPNVFRSILEAGAASRAGWSERTAANLLMAEAALAAKLQPVTAESLRICAQYRKSWVRRLWGPIATLVLAVLIVLYSTAAFLFSGFSTNIRDSIAIANPLAVKLTDELGSVEVTNDKLCPNSGTAAGAPSGAVHTESPLPAGIHRKDVILDLQTFAAAIRDMYGAARQMNRLYLFTSKQPDPIVPSGVKFTPKDYADVLELPAGLPNPALAAAERVCVYQRVRYYAQSTEKNATVFIGAVATCILPVLYALLGACAYVLRRLEGQIRANTFIADMHSPRFITAAIAGAVVGLFNFGSGVSVSPLAIAFLAGYAVDVFFSFLESLIQTLSKPRDKEGSGGTSSSPPGPA